MDNSKEFRDLCAAFAMSAYIQKHGLNRQEPKVIAVESFDMADAMLAERNKRDEVIK